MNTDVEKKMKAGRELDALVAERVMGWYNVGRGYLFGNDDSWGGDNPQTPDKGIQDLPHYSTDIKAAWEVVERVSAVYQIKVGSDKTAFAWWCEIGEGDWRSIGQPTAALAICKAVLKAADHM
jgi:hypothetical protein